MKNLLYWEMEGQQFFFLNLLHHQLFNGTFLRAMEDGGVKLLKERLEKFFHRVSIQNFICNLGNYQTDCQRNTDKFASHIQTNLEIGVGVETQAQWDRIRPLRKQICICFGFFLSFNLQFIFFLNLFCHMANGTLDPQRRIRPTPPALETQSQTLDHQGSPQACTRELELPASCAQLLKAPWRCLLASSLTHLCLSVWAYSKAKETSLGWIGSLAKSHILVDQLCSLNGRHLY